MKVNAEHKIDTLAMIQHIVRMDLLRDPPESPVAIALRLHCPGDRRYARAMGAKARNAHSARPKLRDVIRWITDAQARGSISRRMKDLIRGCPDRVALTQSGRFS